MSWKTSLQLSDLSAPERLELICSGCQHVAKIYPGDPIIARLGHLHLDELETRARCRTKAVRGRKGCGSPMRLILCSGEETSSFQAGIA